MRMQLPLIAFGVLIAASTAASPATHHDANAASASTLSHASSASDAAPTHEPRHGGGRMSEDMDGPPEGHGPMMQFLHDHAQELGLSEAQKTKIHAIIEHMQGRFDEERASVSKEQNKLDEMLSGDSPNKSAIDDQIDKLARLRADFAKERVGAHLEMRAILTPAQREKLKDVMERQHAEHPHGPRAPHHPGASSKSQ